jgi:hypothetical protein
MPLTYEDSAALMNDNAFRGRVKVACLTYADYISGEAANVPAHNTRYKWAQQCFQSPDATAQQVTPAVVMDPSVQQDGAAIVDTELQVAVETAVNKIL